MNLDCLCAPLNPSQPVVPSAGKYITGVVAPDLLPPADAAAAAHPPFPNPAILLRLLPPPLAAAAAAPSRALAVPDPKDASDVGRLLSGKVRGAWWRRDDERIDCALLEPQDEQGGCGAGGGSTVLRETRLGRDVGWREDGSIGIGDGDAG